MATLRELKTRIGSVTSSEKITGAMKMISSAKVHKFESSLRELVPYKDKIRSIMGHILESGENFDSPLIEKREVQRAAFVLFGSDDGLCGAYNVNIYKKLLIEIESVRRRHGDNIEITIFPIGKKVVKIVSKIDDPKVKMEVLPGVDSKMAGEKVTEFSLGLQKRFIDGEFDLVTSVYTHFVSMGRQVLTGRQMLPVEASQLNAENAEAGETRAEEEKMYIFEPDAGTIFDKVLPMFVLSDMQEITIENRTSEQAARVIAMQSANDNAKKLLEELQLEYNKLRQQSITAELLDLLGGQVER